MPVKKAAPNKAAQSKTAEELFLKGYRWGEIISALRLNASLTLEDLAQSCNSYKGYMSMVERSLVRPLSWEKILGIAGPLGVDPKRLALYAIPERIGPEVVVDVTKALRQYVRPATTKRKIKR